MTNDNGFGIVDFGITDFGITNCKSQMTINANYSK